eukprot:scaffold20938_cov116-Isochrysis_galbana.AAC.4
MGRNVARGAKAHGPPRSTKCRVPNAPQEKEKQENLRWRGVILIPGVRSASGHNGGRTERTCADNHRARGVVTALLTCTLISCASRSTAALPTPYATLKVYDLPPNELTRQMSGGGTEGSVESPLAAVSIIRGVAAQHVA